MTDAYRTILLIFSGLLGLVVGSFLNVCIFRLPRNCMSIVKPRSRCPRCLAWIAWYDNLPVVSWLMLGAKCRRCKLPISVRYTLVELLTGALYFYAGWIALYQVPDPGWSQAAQFAVHAWLIGAMIVCTFIDLEFRILPDEITLSGIVIGLLASAVLAFLAGNPWYLGLAYSVLGAFLGGGSIFLVGVLGKWVFRKDAMGFGDVKYMAMIGAVLGWRGVLLTFLVACLLGSIFGIGKFIVVRRMGYVPFGPFLSSGALVLLFWSPLVDAAIKAYMSFVTRLMG